LQGYESDFVPVGNLIVLVKPSLSTQNGNTGRFPYEQNGGNAFHVHGFFSSRDVTAASSYIAINTVLKAK